MTDKFKDHDQRFFTSREIDEQEAEEARRALLRQGTKKAEPEPTPALTRAERLANFRRLSEAVDVVVDTANEARKNGRRD